MTEQPRARRFLRQGSAYLFVIGVISVLMVIVVYSTRTNVSRHHITRLMSNEKKAEALAEAAVDVAIGYIKESMNDPNDPNFYPYFRIPAPIQGSSLGDNSGNNIPIDATVFNKPIDLVWESAPMAPIQTLINNDLGGRDFASCTVFCQILNAEAFSAARSGYQVVGVSIKAPPTQGSSLDNYPARFLDDFGADAGSAQAIANWFKDWELDYYLPNKTNQDECEVEVLGLVADAVADAKVILYKISNTVARAVVVIKVGIPNLLPFGPRLLPLWEDTWEKTIDFEEFIKKYVNISEPQVTLGAILRQAMGASIQGKMASMQWEAQILRDSIVAGFNALKQMIKDQADKSTAYSPAPRVVEKGGIIRLRAVVEYRPHGAAPNGEVIRRQLIADRHFKVTDIQPVAPEYSFFIANSSLLCEQSPSDAPTSGPVDGNINWTDAGIATLVIHNLPCDASASPSYAALTGFTGGGGAVGPDSVCQVPGMVRINSAGPDPMKINTFLGTKDEPWLTEFNAMMMDKHMGADKFQLIPTFNWFKNWTSSNPSDRPHEVDFPVLRGGEPPPDTWPNHPYGLKHLLNLLNFCDALSGPTLLFGNGHFEYPLNLRVEARLQMRYANILFGVKPRGQQNDEKDQSQAYIRYINKYKDYGIQGLPPYQSANDWKPSDPRNMPPNLYSTLQYAKKANHFFESESDFWADRELFPSGPGGPFKINGVVYVKGNLNVSQPLQVDGKGILVVKDNIYLNADVKRLGPLGQTIFTLIARRGYIRVQGGCRRIEASCFSNDCLRNAGGHMLAIDGNLVLNHFDRDHIESTEVFYNSAACRVSPLSVMRDVGKFDPKRYIVSVGKRWARFEYEKF
ncbi:MAG: hypothetical protein OZSIB_3740 [Candidatus Ozemobacter sibiricus]|jgi:hypothetical protein|uniref:Uncharacterized protein n=1 Tax=Candidatus Ozemobacter sibiricus TaxID=2268124 RepID=A0A367ZD86_9BACT|nr:MAG: hypothetical protein OZSIB_3740 [Candidatus Ozemobacter sibiricus]